MVYAKRSLSHMLINSVSARTKDLQKGSSVKVASCY